VPATTSRVELTVTAEAIVRAKAVEALLLDAMTRYGLRGGTS
jgi:hypothetical protein